MAFLVKNFDSFKTGLCGTAVISKIIQIDNLYNATYMPPIMKVAALPNWFNLRNYSTSGTSGTTVAGGGNYPWVG